MSIENPSNNPPQPPQEKQGESSDAVQNKPPEQPKEEQLTKDGEGTPEGPRTPEPYNEAEWDKLKQGHAAFAINKGKEMGVPQEELDRFAADAIARGIEEQDYGFVYRFRKNMGVGTEEEVRAAGEQAYKFFLESGDSGSAMSIAEDVCGRDSDEWKRASEMNEAAWKETEGRRKRKREEAEGGEREPSATISKDATFADLFRAIDAVEEEEGLGALHFEEELWDNFDATIVEEVLAFRDIQAGKAWDVRVLDFFKERDYSQSDVSTFLPIKFK